MIKQSIMVLLAFFMTAIASAQDVRYYKLTRKEENGVSSKNVSGGQFITFISDICYESNKKGLGVGHGNMTRNSNYSTSQYSVYQGSSYWGKDATFKFNADKSVLNVVLENGDVYIYKRATPPAGQETCSLIRKSNSGSSGNTPIITPTYPISPTPTPIPNQNTITTPAPSSREPHEPRHGTRQKEVTCPVCHGTKTCETCYGRGWINSPYTGQSQTCPTCHGNKNCWKCNGTGVITKTEYY